MLGIDPDEQRRMMGEGLDAVDGAAASPDPVTIETDWFTMRDARLQLRPFTDPHLEVAVAGSFSPAGTAHAGRARRRPHLDRRHVAGGLRPPGVALGGVRGRGGRPRPRGRSIPVAPGRRPCSSPTPTGRRGRRRATATSRSAPTWPTCSRPRPAPRSTRSTSRSTGPTPAAPWSSARPSAPSPRSNGCWTSPAGSAPCCSTAATGATTPPPCGPMRSSPSG